MPEEDRVFKESVFVESDKLREQSIGVIRRWKHYRTDELLAARREVSEQTDPVC